jgi:hypothetical protein
MAHPMTPAERIAELEEVVARLEGRSAITDLRVRARFDARWMPEPTTGCWLWFGTPGNWGYGSMSINSRSTQTHRIAWRLYVETIPKGLRVLHTCDTPACVNPAHLYLGTHQDNMDDMRRKGRGSNQNTKKTHCMRGHPFNEENTYRGTIGRRGCRICRMGRQRRYRRRAQCL